MRKTIQLHEFMSGEYKTKQKERRQRIIRKSTKIASAAILPLATLGTVGTLGFAMTTLAATTNAPVTVAPMVLEVGAKQWAGETALSTLAHALDPVIDILVALSFPIASVVIVGSCFLFMFGNSEKAWTGIQNAGLGYVLIQVSPVILEVLKKVGESV
jgi:nitrate reductase NapE component